MALRDRGPGADEQQQPGCLGLDGPDERIGQLGRNDELRVVLPNEPMAQRFDPATHIPDAERVMDRDVHGLGGSWLAAGRTASRISSDARCRPSASNALRTRRPSATSETSGTRAWI